MATGIHIIESEHEMGSVGGEVTLNYFVNNRPQELYKADKIECTNIKIILYLNKYEFGRVRRLQLNGS